MLDLVGYTQEANLMDRLIVEPGCGDGVFVEEIVRRLIIQAKSRSIDLASLEACLRAYDIDAEAINKTRDKVRLLLSEAGSSATLAAHLAQTWVREEDFLLLTPLVAATWVVGNPPYVRVEEITPELHARYRSRFTSMTGRADVYVGFFEAALDRLTPQGSICFIAADRWMHNQYGAALRRKVLTNNALDLLLEVHSVDAFDVRVLAYPAITVIRRGDHRSTVLATASARFNEPSANNFLAWYATPRAPATKRDDYSAAHLAAPLPAGDSWPFGPPELLELLSRVEAVHDSLDRLDVQIGVGVATGADRVYIVRGKPDVEPDRLRPAIGPADLRDGSISWLGRFIINPWTDDGLVSLADYPRLETYLMAHEDTLKSRHAAKHRGGGWWRTIDKPRDDLYSKPKLVLADLNDQIEPVLDLDGYWPLHSAYFITSDTWDLEVLGGYLLSSIAAAFISAYSVRMGTGHRRISSQYLRKIRAPRYDQISAEQAEQLRTAFRQRDRTLASYVASALLGLPPQEITSALAT